MTNIRDVVLPVIELNFSASGIAEYKCMLGSSFRLENSNLILTAKHVVENHTAPVFLYFHGTQCRYAIGSVVALHDTLDIAICSAEIIDLPQSFLKLDTSLQNATLDYQCWGYPSDHLHDFGVFAANGTIQEIPDLVFTKGYVRRLFNHSVPGLYGSKFYELSEIAGSGCSGSPILRLVRNINQREVDWYAFGIYVGERTLERGGNIREIAYAVRFDEISDWLQENGF